MYKIIIICFVLLVTSCEPLVLEAEADLTDAQTVQIETQSDADAITALIKELGRVGDQNQIVVNTLLAEVEAGRISNQQMMNTLLEMVAEQNTQSPWVIILPSVLLILAVVWIKRKPDRIVIIPLSSGQQISGVLSSGKQWAIKEIEEVEMIYENVI